MLSSLELLETNMKRMCWNGIGSGWESALKNIDELDENGELKWLSLVETPTKDLFCLVSCKGLINRCDTYYPAFVSDGLKGGRVLIHYRFEAWSDSPIININQKENYFVFSTLVKNSVLSDPLFWIYNTPSWVRLSHLLRSSPAAALLVDVVVDEDADEAVAAVAETLFENSVLFWSIFSEPKILHHEWDCRISLYCPQQQHY